MTKPIELKVGDRVVRTTDFHGGAHWQKGDKAELIRLEKDGFHHYRRDRDSEEWYSAREHLRKLPDRKNPS